MFRSSICSSRAENISFDRAYHTYRIFRHGKPNYLLRFVLITLVDTDVSSTRDKSVGFLLLITGRTHVRLGLNILLTALLACMKDTSILCVSRKSQPLNEDRNIQHEKSNRPTTACLVFLVRILTSLKRQIEHLNQSFVEPMLITSSTKRYELGSCFQITT